MSATNSFFLVFLTPSQMSFRESPFGNLKLLYAYWFSEKNGIPCLLIIYGLVIVLAFKIYQSRKYKGQLIANNYVKISMFFCRECDPVLWIRFIWIWIRGSASWNYGSGYDLKSKKVKLFFLIFFHQKYNALNYYLFKSLIILMYLKKD